MTSNLASYEPGPDDDGFHGSLNSGRLTKGTIVRWNDQGWQDRDGLAPPSPLLVVAVNEVLQKWKDNKPEVISAKPLPDPEELNSTIPVAEWEMDLTGQPRKPWAHTVVVYFVDPGAGGFFTFASSTIGAHIAVDNLRESVVSMRMLRGARVMPLVNLGERPMKTKFGMKTRPHFNVVGWKTPPSDSAALATEATPQQLAPPAPPAPPPTPEAKEVPPPAHRGSMTMLRQAKPPVNLAAETLVAMGEIKPAAAADFFDDEIPFG